MSKEHGAPANTSVGIHDSELDAYENKANVMQTIVTLLRPLTPIDRLKVMRGVAAEMGYGLPTVPESLAEMEDPDA